MSEIASGGLQPGQIVDRYAIDSVLGKGGMAVVYRVRHLQLGSFHALKVLTLHGEGIRDRMLQEGRVQASMHHPNVVTVTDVLDLGGSPGLVMEYIDGPSLDHWLDGHRPSLDEVDAIFRAIVAGVAAAHERGLVHRDLKPANVLLQPAAGGFVPKVADFGLAKALVDDEGTMKRTRSGVTMGTPQYMAPEQIRDAKNVDARADIFSLGCILYELVAGRPPFEGPDLLAIFNAVAHGDYKPIREVVPEVPKRYVEAIDGCLRVDRELRLASCGALFEVFGGASVSGFIPIPRPSESMPDAPRATTNPGNATFVTEAASMAPVAAAPAVGPSATAGPAASDPSLITRSNPPSLVSGRSVAVAAGVGGIGVGLVAVAAVGLIAVVVVGFVGLRMWRTDTGGAFAAAYDVTAAISDPADNGGIALSDVAIGAGDGAWHATSVTFEPGARGKRIRELAIDGLTGVVAGGPAGWALPSTLAKATEAGALAIHGAHLPGGALTFRTPAGDLVASWGKLDLVDVELGGASGWTATSLRAEAPAVAIGDFKATAASVALGSDGIAHVETPELTVRSRTDGLLDVPPALAGWTPDWLGGTASSAAPFWGIGLAWLPIDVVRVDVNGGAVHLVDRANADRAATWDVALSTATIGPRSDGDPARVPFSLSGRVGDAPVSADGDVRADGLVRASVRVRDLPVATFAPYVEASTRRHHVAIAGGSLDATIDLSVKDGEVAGGLDGDFANVVFTADGVVENRDRKLLTPRDRVAVQRGVDGSLSDGSSAPVNAMFRAIADALFAPVGGADWRVPAAAAPPEPRPVSNATVANATAAAAVKEPDFIEPEPVPDAIPPDAPAPPDAPVDAPAPGPLTPAQRVERARSQVDKLHHEVRDALDELKRPLPPK